jgi:hypothetical protein
MTKSRRAGGTRELVTLPSEIAAPDEARQRLRAIPERVLDAGERPHGAGGVHDEVSAGPRGIAHEAHVHHPRIDPRLPKLEGLKRSRHRGLS